jgi:hypothetical protein
MLRRYPPIRPGDAFGRWTVLEGPLKRDSWWGYCWFCQCSCGSVSLVRGQSLKSGSSVSCGCYRRELARNLARQQALARSEGLTLRTNADILLTADDDAWYQSLQDAMQKKAQRRRTSFLESSR